MYKKAIIYLSGIGLFVAVLSFSYYASYKMSLNRFKEEKELAPKEMEMAEEIEEVPTEVAETNTVKIDRITENTRCILEVYDLDKNLLEKGEASVNQAFFGFTREEVLLHLEAFLEEMPEKEKEKGLVSYDLVSFSSETMVLRKSYDTNRVKYEFFMKAEGNEIVVLYSDKGRVFEYTGLFLDHLPDKEQERLREGFYVKDREELYGILENYSS